MIELLHSLKFVCVYVLTVWICYLLLFLLPHLFVHYTQLLTVSLIFLELVCLLLLFLELSLLTQVLNYQLHLIGGKFGVLSELICGSYRFLYGFMDVECKVKPFDLVTVLQHLLSLRVVTDVVYHALVGHKTHVLLHELPNLFRRLN